MAGKQFSYIYHIVTREGTDKKFWMRIGTAWHNKDGSINCQFDCFPAGTPNIQIRKPTEKDESGANFGE